MVEVWKEVENYDGDYLISNYGEVKSLKKKPRILKKRKNRYGYFYVNLCKNGKYKSLDIHRLVALHFLNNSYKKQVNHKDGKKSNNNLCNLEFVTAKENIQHAKGLPN